MPSIRALQNRFWPTFILSNSDRVSALLFSRSRRHLLGTLNYLDMTRVGVWGWGYGGYVTAMLMGSQQEVFKCGVAVSPIVDWLYYSKQSDAICHSWTIWSNLPGYPFSLSLQTWRLPNESWDCPWRTTRVMLRQTRHRGRDIFHPIHFS